jgi:hypothetical protein
MGTHDELLKQPGLYQNIAEIQTKMVSLPKGRRRSMSGENEEEKLPDKFNPASGSRSANTPCKSGLF